MLKRKDVHFIESQDGGKMEFLRKTYCYLRQSRSVWIVYNVMEKANS